MNTNDVIKEKNNKKRIISIAIVSVFIVVLVSLIVNFTFSIDTANEFYGVSLKDTEVANITISNVNIKEENGITKYEATISAKEEKNINYIKIIFKDEDNNEIISLIGYVGYSLTAHKEKKIEASTDADLSKVKSIEYEIV